MTILAVAHFYIEHNAAGGEMYLHRLLRELAKKHKVHVWVTEGEKSQDTVIEGVNVYYRNPDVKPDVLVSHFLNNSPRIQALSSIHQAPVAWIVHNDNIRTQKEALKFKPSDLLIFNTEWIANLTKAHAKKIVLHPPVDIDEFKTTPGDHITLVNLNPEKGTKTFYKLTQMLPDEKFLGVTGGYFTHKFDHRELPNLEIIPQTLNMKDDVYKRTKIVLMPSERESYGMVATEAFCSEIPVIAHPTEGLKENLGNAGIFIDRDKPELWAKAIQKLNNKSEYKKQQTLIRKHMETKDFTLDKAVKAIEDLYAN